MKRKKAVKRRRDRAASEARPAARAAAAAPRGGSGPAGIAAPSQPPSPSPPSAALTTASPPWFATAEPGDHAETPPAAYAHVAPALRSLAAALGRGPAALRLYDPYFCQGAAAARLAALGFASVRNEPVDFYAVIASPAGPPAFDALVTNPPFSGDNIPRLLAFCERRPEPWLLLLPEFVAARGPFRRLAAARAAQGRPPVLFLGPAREPYAFDAPPAVGGVGAERGAGTGSDAEPDADADADADADKEGAGEGEGGGAVVDDRASRGAGRVVRPGSFQCVWFCSGLSREQLLGRASPAPAPALPADSGRQRRTAPGRASRGEEEEGAQAEGGAACALSPDGAYAVADSVAALPRLAPAARLTPAERRWRKKQRRLAGGDG